MSLTLYLPKNFDNHTIRTSLQKAVDEGFEPVKPPPEPRQRLILHIPLTLKAIVKKRAPQNMSEYASSLVWAVIQQEKGVNTRESNDNEPDNKTICQQKYLEHIKNALDGGYIAIAEGSTGLGKTRVGGRAAEHLLNKDSSNCIWVAVPTIQVLYHTLSEYHAIGLDRVAPLLGIGQFVSRERTYTFLNKYDAFTENYAPESIEKVIQWLDTGGLPITDTSRKLNNLGVPARYMLSDLQSILPDIPKDMCCLNYTETDDKAYAHFESMRISALESPVVVTTHARLAIEVIRNRDETFGWSHLIIDEAHDYERTVANILSHDVSFHSLKCLLKQYIKSGVLPQKTGNTLVSDISKMVKRLQSGFSKDDYLSGNELESDCRTLIADIYKAIKKRKKKIQEAGMLLPDVDNIPEKTSVLVKFSPKLHYPSLVFGPKSIKGCLSKQWRNCKGAALMSGTLYVQTDKGYSCRFMQSKLCVPWERSYTFDPVVMDWTLTVPDLYLPKKEESQLRYPKVSDPDISDKDFENWRIGIVDVIKQILEWAYGGSLILCASHADRKAINLALYSVLQSRVLSDLPPSIDASKHIYMEQARAGLRPIWVATGAAWTGLDLLDDENTAENDFALTDLIIPRIPFWLNQSSTHLHRYQYQGFRAEAMESFFTLRQGIGRLIRREGVKRRRIHLLDPRLSDDTVSYLKTYRKYIWQFPHRHDIKELLTH